MSEYNIQFPENDNLKLVSDNFNSINYVQRLFDLYAQQVDYSLISEKLNTLPKENDNLHNMIRITNIPRYQSWFILPEKLWPKCHEVILPLNTFHDYLIVEHINCIKNILVNDHIKELNTQTTSFIKKCTEIPIERILINGYISSTYLLSNESHDYVFTTNLNKTIVINNPITIKGVYWINPNNTTQFWYSDFPENVEIHWLSEMKLKYPDYLNWNGILQIPYLKNN